MNYLELINNFWREDDKTTFTSRDTRLYFYLLHIANRNYWASWFELGDAKTCVNVGVSVAVLRTSRNKLQAMELIKFITGGNGHGVKTRYQILPPKLASKQTPKLSPLYKTKNNNNINKDEKFSKRAYIASGSDFDE